MATENLSHSQSMIRLVRSYIATRVIYVAAKLGLADHIRDDGASAQNLAQILNVHPGALYRVMRTLAGLGVLHQDEHDRFFVTQFGETLRKDSPQPVRDYAIYIHEFVYDSLSNITESVRTGKPMIDDFFAYLQSNPELETIFHAAMGNQGRIETKAILQDFDFSKCRQVVDVGGGNGAFLSSLLGSYNQVSGILFDQESAIRAAESGRGGSLSRCELVAGDFFDRVPSGGDTYILKRVLLDWTDKEAIKILENCRKAADGDARLLIIEPLIDSRNEQTPAHLYDITFLVLLTGRVRSVDEYSALLSRAGFRLEKIIPTDSDVSILEALIA